MSNLDEEKDIYIKNKFQEDKLISKKADDIFNKINKGEFFMENNEELKNENFTKENVVNFKKKSPKWKKILATAASLVIVVGAANVYATSQGYDNVFFLIKYLVTGEKVDGKDNILSDRDITISYEPINIAQDLSVIIKKLQVKDNKAVLYVISNDKNNADKNLTPLKFIAYNNENEKLCEQTSKEDLKAMRTVTDELTLNNFKESDKIINLEIYGANSEKLATLKIDLDGKTVEVQGEKEALQKISEIELKEFLGYAAGLSRDLGITEDVIKVDLACNMILDKKLDVERDSDSEYLFLVDEVNNVIESFTGEKAENLKNERYFKVVTKNGKKYYKYVYVGEKQFKAECINISNISYCNGLYTVNYSYYYRGPEGDEDINMDYYDVYEQEVCISLNENSEYSKFKVVSMEEPTIIKKASETNTNNTEVATTNNNLSNNEQTTSNSSSNASNNNTNTNSSSNEKVDNYASTMSWKEYWAPGIKFQYPTIFKLEEVGGYYRGTSQGQVSTKITGIAKGINPDTKERIDSDLEIRIYEPMATDEVESEYMYDVDGTTKATLTSNGLKWYESKMGGNGEPYTETYTHLETFADGKCWIYTIEFETKGEFNFKARNIATWLIGTVKLTSY